MRARELVEGDIVAVKLGDVTKFDGVVVYSEGLECLHGGESSRAKKKTKCCRRSVRL